MTKLSPIPPQPLASRHKGLLPQPTPCTGTPCVCPRHCPSRDIYFKLRQLLCLIQCVTPDEARAGFPHSSLFTPLPSLLAFGRSGLFGPPLCGGSAPATPPPTTPAASSVWQYDLGDPRRPGFTPPPRVLADSEYVPAQARQARQLPYIPNVHRHDHREPAIEILTVHSPQTDR